MKAPVTHGSILKAVFKKELRLYGRNKVYLFLTVLTLVAFAVVFQIIPDTVDEAIVLGISPSLEEILAEGKDALRELGFPEEQLQELEQADFSGEEGLDLVVLQSKAQLQRAVEGKLEVYRNTDGALILRDTEAGEKKPKGAKRVRLDMGIAFPANFIADVAGGEKTTVTVYADAALPAEIRGAMQSMVREIAYEIGGQGLPVELPEEEMIILGPDRTGAQASIRDKLRPMFALFILMVETFAMASLISIEVLQRTVTALLVTPMRVWHFLAAKTLFGTFLALTQGLLLLVFVGAFTPANWHLLIITMLIGAVLFTAVAMIVGSAGKDFMGQLMYSMLFIIPLMIPAFSVLFPGTAAIWVRAIPSYPVIDLLVGATIYNAGWAESWGILGYALLWVAALFGVGLLLLKRKVETL